MSEAETESGVIQRISRFGTSVNPDRPMKIFREIHDQSKRKTYARVVLCVCSQLGGKKSKRDIRIRRAFVTRGNGAL